MNLSRQKFSEIDEKAEASVSEPPQEQLRQLTNRLPELESFDELRAWR